MQAPGNKPGRQPVTGPDSDRQWRHGGPRSPARPYPSPSHGPDRRRLGRCERHCDFQPRLRVSVAGSSPELLVTPGPQASARGKDFGDTVRDTGAPRLPSLRWHGELSELQVIAGPGCALVSATSMTPACRRLLRYRHRLTWASISGHKRGHATWISEVDVIQIHQLQNQD